MTRFISLAEKLSRFFGIVACLLIVPLLVFTGYEVVMRYVFQSPTIWVWDLNIILFAGIVMLGGADTLRTNSHVGMDFLVQNFPPENRAILDLVTGIIFYVGLVALLVFSWNQAWMSWKSQETMSTIWAPPYYLMKMLIPVGALLVILQGVVNTYGNAVEAFGINKGD